MNVAKVRTAPNARISRANASTVLADKVKRAIHDDFRGKFDGVDMIRPSPWFTLVDLSSGHLWWRVPADLILCCGSQEERKPSEPRSGLKVADKLQDVGRRFHFRRSPRPVLVTYVSAKHE